MSKADEILYKNEFEKNEKYIKGKLKEITYKTNYKFISNTKIMFSNDLNSLTINGEIKMEILQAINLKCKELGWIE